MRSAFRARWLGFAIWFLGPAACSSPDTDCTCAVENNGQRRTIVCGESACVGGTTLTCTDRNQSVKRSACVAPAAGRGFDAGATTPGQNPTPDHSCDDLLTFCNTNCGSPASVSADCLTTASSGDPAACAAWQLSNGVLCHP
jgi:hypothetical protein